MTENVVKGPLLSDPVRSGLARGWSVIDASSLDRDRVLEADVAIVGTGAGGGIAAEILAVVRRLQDA